MHKAQRGHKLSVVRKVVTPFNFVTPPSFSVTPPSCKPQQYENELEGPARSAGAFVYGLKA
jgi:hypothetical protein